MKFTDYINLVESKINKLYEEGNAKAFLQSLTAEELYNFFNQLNNMDLLPENTDKDMLAKINKHFNTFEDFTSYIEELYMYTPKDNLHTALSKMSVDDLRTYLHGENNKI